MNSKLRIDIFEIDNSMKYQAFMILITSMFFSSVLNAQHGNFFWSTANLEQGAVEGDFDIQLQKGSTTTLFLYFDTFGVHNITEGFEIDFSWTNSDIVHFSHAETFDYDILIQGIPFMVRYGDFAGPATTIDDNSVEGFRAVNVVGGTGLLASQDGSDLFLDAGYDFSSQSFQIGIITFDAVGVGTTKLQIDDALIVDGGMNNDSAFSSLTITVVPEPAVGFLLSFGFAAIHARRRPKQ